MYVMQHWDGYNYNTYSVITAVITCVFQEEALAEARQVEGEAATYLDAITRYFVHRAKLCGKLAKYPHLVGSEMHVLIVYNT